MKYLRDQEAITLFGLRLRQLRKARGLTQENLAALAGIEFSQIGRIERGIISTSLSTVFAISRALEIDVRELFNWSGLPSHTNIP